MNFSEFHQVRHCILEMRTKSKPVDGKPRQYIPVTPAESLPHVESAAIHQAHRLVADEPNRLATYSVEMDLIEKLKRIYYFAKRMAKTVPSTPLAEQVR